MLVHKLLWDYLEVDNLGISKPQLGSLLNQHFGVTKNNVSNIKGYQIPENVLVPV